MIFIKFQKRLTLAVLALTNLVQSTISYGKILLHVLLWLERKFTSRYVKNWDIHHDNKNFYAMTPFKIERTAVFTFTPVTQEHSYRLQSDTSYLPLIMKLPVVRYSPEGAVLDTWSW